MKVTIQKEATDGAIKVVEEKKRKSVKEMVAEPKGISSLDVNLGVDDGFRFGFGVVLSLLLWSAILTLVSLIAWLLFNKLI
jgi:hypothetical protein